MLGEMREKEILPDLQSALVQLGGIQLDMAGKLPTSDEIVAGLPHQVSCLQTTTQIHSSTPLNER